MGMVRARYTLEFKQEAVRLVRGGQTVSSVAKTLGLLDQTLHNWLKAEAAGRLREFTGKAVSAEQMEIARLNAELAKTRMECDILKTGAGSQNPIAALVIPTRSGGNIARAGRVLFLRILDDLRQRSAAKSTGIMDGKSMVPSMLMSALGGRPRVQSHVCWRATDPCRL